MASTNYQRFVQLLVAETTNNGVPATNGAGISLSELRDPISNKLPEFASVVIKGSGTGGAVSAVFRLWLHFPGIGMMWAPAGNGTGADKGKLNDAAAVDEVTTDSIVHAQPIRLSAHADRMYLEVLSISGTATTINAVVVVEK